jgi:hypothetical protein
MRSTLLILWRSIATVKKEAAYAALANVHLSLSCFKKEWLCFHAYFITSIRVYPYIHGVLLLSDTLSARSLIWEQSVSLDLYTVYISSVKLTDNGRLVAAWAHTLGVPPGAVSSSQMRTLYAPSSTLFGYFRDVPTIQPLELSKRKVYSMNAGLARQFTRSYSGFHGQSIGNQSRLIFELIDHIFCYYCPSMSFTTCCTMSRAKQISYENRR